MDKLEGVQKRAMRMAGGLGQGNAREACRGVGLNMIKEELEVSDMVRVYRIMYNHDKVDKTTFWNLAKAREGAGRRRFKEKEMSRTVSIQRKDIRKNSFGSRVQDPWNILEDQVKLCKNPKAFRVAYRRSKNRM